MREVIQIDGQVTINKQALRKAVLLLRAIRLPVCRRIIETLDEAAPREMCVSDLVEWFEEEKIAQSVVSLHLGLLRRHKVVTVRQSGRMHYYNLNYETIINITNAVQKFLFT